MNLEIEYLTQVINSWDPVGLLAGGAPDNEYDIEIREIAQKSLSCNSEVDLATLIWEVFKDRMGIKLNKLACLKQAFEITKNEKY
ncbi:hypothetical protein GCM10008018_72610 [Paenibacillus marchantiophytorum]|uniref:DUF1871 family protein n=1 Tax=Paenibacillus marchantiophytorum TaxID=1619310 RepID=A0ABQ1FL09_9BACL|nr:hypothetical protein [Paenibacillus marchantiophytorum]GGA18052.1 hypothetical protein GCM10008018_72610 [Paenibacillus marchantiophytorum]